MFLSFNKYKGLKSAVTVCFGWKKSDYLNLQSLFTCSGVITYSVDDICRVDVLREKKEKQIKD